MSLNERVDSLTRKRINKQADELTFQFKNAGTSIVTKIPLSEMPETSILNNYGHYREPKAVQQRNIYKEDSE